MLTKIKAGIDEKRIETWRYITNANGDYFTHVTPNKQWEGKAWLKPSVQEDQLVFNIVRPEGKNVSKKAYAVYHGRFAEMILAHFDNEFTTVWATALAKPGDLV